MAIAALIGGIGNWWANGAEWSWRGLGYYFTGVLAGALSATTGGLISSSLSSVCFISGAVSGMVSGGTSGLILGSGNSWLQGSSFGGGLISGFKASFTGSIIGGLSSGISSGLTALNNGGDFWTGKGATYECFGNSDFKVTIGENMEYSNEYAQEFSNEWFGPIVRNVNELHANGDLPNLTQYYKRGDLVYKISEGGKQSLETWGSCVDLGIGNGYDVYLYKAAFTSNERLYLTMGHEYLHAIFGPMSNTIPRKYRGYYQHAAIYDWAQTQAKVWDFNASYYQAMYNKFSAYIPSNPYSYIKAGFYILPINPF